MRVEYKVIGFVIVTPCEMVEGKKVGSIGCTNKCAHFISHDAENCTVECGYWDNNESMQITLQLVVNIKPGMEEIAMKVIRENASKCISEAENDDTMLEFCESAKATILVNGKPYEPETKDLS